MRYTSCTASGMSIHRSVENSCSHRARPKIGAMSSTVNGSRVPGCRCGGGASGRSGTMLYHCVGISDSGSSALTRVSSTMSILQSSRDSDATLPSREVAGQRSFVR